MAKKKQKPDEDAATATAPAPAQTPEPLSIQGLPPGCEVTIRVEEYSGEFYGIVHIKLGEDQFSEETLPIATCKTAERAGLSLACDIVADHLAKVRATKGKGKAEKIKTAEAVWGRISQVRVSHSLLNPQSQEEAQTEAEADPFRDPDSFGDHETVEAPIRKGAEAQLRVRIFREDEKWYADAALQTRDGKFGWSFQEFREKGIPFRKESRREAILDAIESSVMDLNKMFKFKSEATVIDRMGLVVVDLEAWAIGFAETVAVEPDPEPNYELEFAQRMEAIYSEIGRATQAVDEAKTKLAEARKTCGLAEADQRLRAAHAAMRKLLEEKARGYPLFDQ